MEAGRRWESAEKLWCGVRGFYFDDVRSRPLFSLPLLVLPESGINNQDVIIYAPIMVLAAIDPVTCLRILKGWTSWNEER